MMYPMFKIFYLYFHLFLPFLYILFIILFIIRINYLLKLLTTFLYKIAANNANKIIAKLNIVKAIQ